MNKKAGKIAFTCYGGGTEGRRKRKELMGGGRRRRLLKEQSWAGAILEVRRVFILSTLTFLSMESTNKENNSKEKSEEHTSCKLTSVEGEEGQGTSGEAEKAKNSAQGTRRKRDTKNSTGKRATVPQIVFLGSEKAEGFFF